MKLRLIPIAMLLLSSPLIAQQRDTVRPFVRGGIYDKPYLTTVMGRAAIGGYAEAHARWNHVDGVTEDSGFELRRFNLFASAQVSDFVRFASELEFEDGGDEVVLEFAAIDIAIHPALTLRGGMILSPLGRFNLSHDSPLNDFTDRPLVSTEVVGVALSEPGLGVLGMLPVANGRVTYELYAVNGFHEGLVTQSEGGTRIPLGRRNTEDNNNAPSFVGRVAWSPDANLEAGLSAHHGPYNVYQQDGLGIAERRDVTILVADAEVALGPLRLAGEVARANIEIPVALRGIYAERQDGAYADLVLDFGRGWVQVMPGSHFSAVVRVDIIDFDRDLRGDSERRFQAGLNFRPTEATVLKLSVLRGTARDRFNNASSLAGLRFSIATYF